ncbi:hypothetical protein OR1_01780 [Geobacter sp. OR-1]|uniref:HEAT repeat domain-containing protein n=1 Tax=Geobacter sp. OR-1 TaxID=1266765 RepID=UPI00054243C6|nr:HEAT repeat domain-containing protein [Geobacter sp. OR-1]GAM09501.1 hypothetical protein OR1_01780 [Geobacter sp. OR-1]
MSPLSDTSTLGLDTRLLSNFIYEFNIARRHVAAYPSNHPIITATLSKVTDLLQQLLLTRDDISLGIAKDTLLIGDSHLDKNNPVYRDVARLFFSHGIAAVSFTKQLGIEDLLLLYRIIALKRDDLDKKGGLLACLAKSGVKGIQVSPINYGAFSATDEEVISGADQIFLEKQSALIWDNFARSLLKGTLADGSQPADNSSLLDPAVLSEIFSKQSQQSETKVSRAASYENTITKFLRKLEEGDRGAEKEELLLRLTAFISRLSPELRRQFLNSAFAALANHQELAGPMLANLPEDAILDALDDLSKRKATLPQTMLDLIGRLSSNLADKARVVSAQGHSIEDDLLKEKLKVIFQEENPDKFVPDNYQKTLHAIIADQAGYVPDHNIEGMRSSLSSHLIEEQISHIILDMISNFPTECDSPLMQRNLQELCGYFLGMGDFIELANIHDKMVRNPAGTSEKSFNFLEIFSEPAFIEEVLNGVNFWGKTKFNEISDLIDRVGAPFAEPVLERLAEEQNMSMRRFYIERLRRIGAPARNAAVARLRDGRWYFVRNLILLLHYLGDISVVPHLRRLTVHPHPKVRQEAVKALLGFRDPEGDNIILRDLDSGDKEQMLNAVRLAENSQNNEVNERLIGYLNRSGLTGFEYELKSASIHSLGAIAKPSSVPGLERFLKSRTILRSSQLNRLKVEAVQSLKKYPAKAVLPLLNSLLQSSQAEIRQAAEESFRQINGGDRVE